MKHLLVIAVVASVISVQILAKKLTTEERMKVKEKCQEQSDVDGDVLDQAIQGNFQDDPKLKKHCKCFYEEVGVLKGNDINKEKLQDFIEIELPDKKDQAKQIAQECSQKKQDEPKDTAYEIGKCVMGKKKQ